MNKNLARSRSNVSFCNDEWEAQHRYPVWLWLIMVAYTVYIVHIKLSNAGVCASQQHKEIADGCICSDHRGVILFPVAVVMYAGLIFLSVQPARELSTEMMGNVGKLKN